jgi:hypothetical protein
LIAQGRFAFADMLEAAPPPKALRSDPTMIAVYRSQVAGFAKPLREQGRQALVGLLEKAQAAKLASPWVAEAEALLAANPG